MALGKKKKGAVAAKKQPAAPKTEDGKVGGQTLPAVGKYAGNLQYEDKIPEKFVRIWKSDRVYICNEKTLSLAEEASMGAYGGLGVPQFAQWISAYFRPYQACRIERKNAGPNSAATNLALAGLVQAVANIIMVALALVFARPGIGVPLTIAGAVVMLIIYPIASIIGGIAVSVMYFIPAKLLGGKGGFWEQAYCMALVSGGIALLMAPFLVLQALPLIGWLFGMAGMALGLYGVISQYRAIRAVHSLSQLSAAVVILVPAFILLALMVLVIGAESIAGLGPYWAAFPAMQ